MASVLKTLLPIETPPSSITTDIGMSTLESCAKVPRKFVLLVDKLIVGYACLIIAESIWLFELLAKILMSAINGAFERLPTASDALVMVIESLPSLTLIVTVAMFITGVVKLSIILN